MGKATVYTHLGNGKYSVLYTPELTATDARLKELEDLKTALDAQLYSTNGLVEARTAAEKVYDDATVAFFYALDDWAWCARQLPPCAEQGALMGNVTARGAARSEAGLALNTIRLAIADNRARYYAATQEAAYMDSTKKGSGAGLMDVWCVDYSPGTVIQSGTVVGTVETFGAKGGYAGGFLPRKWVNIQTSMAPAYVAARDHCVKPLSGIKTAAMFFNWCQWLYVMSKNPLHAVGTVLSKFDPEQDYLDIELFGGTPGASMPAGYPYDGSAYSVTLLNVPVTYLSCGARAFLEGDQAVVHFSGINRSTPRVIGFAENPRECGDCEDTYIYPWHGLATDGILVTQDDTFELVARLTDGEVIVFDSAINPPALFSGSERVHCGVVPLGSPKKWVWESSPTQKYVVSLVNPRFTVANSTAPASYAIAITMVSVGSPGSSSFTITGTLAGDWTDYFEYEYPLTSNMDVCDVSSDGSKAILCGIRRSVETKKDGQRGFFLLTITSSTTATISALADNEACNPYAYVWDEADHAMANIPVWMWFDADDNVQTVYFSFSAYTETLNQVALTLGGVVQDSITCTDSGVVWAGEESGRMGGYSRLNTWYGREPFSQVEVAYNVHKWAGVIWSYYGADPGVPENNTVFIADVMIYSNRAIGLRMRMHSYNDSTGVFTHTDTHYGPVIHPAGPADPGTRIGTANTAVFDASLSGGVMDVTAVTSGTLIVGAKVVVSEFSQTYITGFLTGSGGIGTYQIAGDYTPKTGTYSAIYAGLPLIDYTPEIGVIHAPIEADRPHTTYQPLTGQLVRNRLEPVCFF